MGFKKQKSYVQAFTIVELLIVIVIIGILAAITVVSYTGITKKANESTLQADLATAKKQFELYKADHGVYPTGLENGTNCLTGTTQPNPDTRYCLKSSGGSAYVLEDATGVDYTLKLTKGTIAYKITKDLAPTSTTAVVAAASFVKTWGGSGSDIGRNITKTNDGGYVIIGYTDSFGSGMGDVLITKYDAGGNLNWNRVWGGSGNDVGFGVVQTADGGYAVTGRTASYGVNSDDVFLVKFDTNGNLSWNKTWGGVGNDTGYNVVQSNDGGYVITGYTTSYGSGGEDMLLIKFDASGNLSWNKLWGGASYDFGYDIAKTSDGGYIISGHTFSYGAGDYDVFIAKYDASGNLSWNKTWGGSSDDQSRSAIQSSDGGYVISGYTSSYGAGISDMFIIKYDASGNLSWNKVWGGASLEFGQSVIQSVDGSYAIAGYTNGYGAGNTDTFVVKYDISGNFSWNRTWGGAGNENCMGLIQSEDGGYILTGYTDSYGVATDMFITKLNSSGNINNCSSPMCQTPTATITTPSATITTPSATVSSPSATVTTPTVTVANPTATFTTVVAP